MTRIVDIWVESDGVTLWQEGADSMTDYFPAIHRVPQRDALRYIAEDGVTESCTVHTGNARRFDRPEGKDDRRARRFAQRAGLPYRERIFFPRRATRLEAVADAAMVPGAVVLCVGEDWVEGRADRVVCYQASTPDDCRGAQIVAHPWIEVAS